eukprot:CAMPEP_0197872612 /NCGR_PEP_ID=MMETSP1439-20131203/2665_1 /TAXON_ID=66791 /ORGANISM="Gonyaulax spinifera, Strain CCMP409" /LENGTH=43 /DNA_ID= /DNA_START= /DNA_END= /DNA_ORIENTATION=
MELASPVNLTFTSQPSSMGELFTRAGSSPSFSLAATTSQSNGA